jgi:hypothetical protein
MTLKNRLIALVRSASRTMSPILLVEHDDEEAELDFELAYLRTLTAQQRFQLMFRKSREIAEMLLKHGHRKPFEIVKRT